MKNGKSALLRLKVNNLIFREKKALYLQTVNKMSIINPTEKPRKILNSDIIQIIQDILKLMDL